MKQPYSIDIQIQILYTNFTKFTRYNLVLNEAADLQSLTLSKKRFRHTCFLMNLAKFLITLF